MVEVGSDDTRVKPREERALTGAIRNVLGGDRAKICFTKGHGEMNPLDVGDQGAGMLKDLLEKDNYESLSVDSAAPNAPEPFKGCGVVVIAGLRGTLTKDEIERLRTWLLADGNLLLAASPIPGDTETGLVPANLQRVLGPFGIGLDEDLVVEGNQELSFPNGGGMRFVGHVQPHAITTALVKSESAHDKEVPRVIVHFSRSLKREPRAREPERHGPPICSRARTSRSGSRASSARPTGKDMPVKRPGDLAGPLVLAMAAEREKSTTGAAHGARVVVIGTANMLTSPTFREPLPLRGGAFFVESAISWLASKPQVARRAGQGGRRRGAPHRRRLAQHHPSLCRRVHARDHRAARHRDRAPSAARAKEELEKGKPRSARQKTRTPRATRRSEERSPREETRAHARARDPRCRPRLCTCSAPATPSPRASARSARTTCSSPGAVRS